MKLLRNLFALLAIYLIAYLVLPGPVRAVKKIDLATVTAWNLPMPRPDDFKERVKAIAKARNYDADIGLFDALSRNESVSNLSASVDDSQPGAALVQIKYTLPEGIDVRLTFATNKTSLIPARADMDAVFSALMAKDPVLIDAKVSQNGQAINLPDDGQSEHGVFMPLGDRLQLELLSDVFSNEPSRIIAVPKAFVGSRKVKTPPPQKQEETKNLVVEQENYGISYKAPHLAFDPGPLNKKLMQKGLGSFINQIENFLTTPDRFIDECVKSGAAYSREKGGLGQQEALQWGVDSCKQYIEQYNKCLAATDIDKAVECFDELSKQGD